MAQKRPIRRGPHARGRAVLWRYRLRTAVANYRRRAEAGLEALDRGRWLAGSVLLPVAAKLSPWGFPNGDALTPYSAVWIFAGLGATSVTLLALQYAITTFRGQQLASRLPSALVSDIFQSNEQRASSWRVAAILITSLWTLGPIDQWTLPSTAATVALTDMLLLIITIASIARSSRRVFDPDYSRNVANLIVRRLDDDYLGNQHARGLSFPPPSLAAGVVTDRPDPFALIEQVCIRAIAEDDLTTARLVLRHITGRVIGYLNGREFVARGVLAWLGETLSVVGRRALLLDERTVTLIMLLFQDVIEWVLQPREQPLRWHDRLELLQFFRELRHTAIQESKPTSVSEGLYVLSRTFETALTTAPPDERVWLLHARDPSPPPHSSDIDLEWEHIYEHWVWELGRDMDLLSAKGLEDSFGTGQFVYCAMMDDVLKSEHLGPRQKHFLIQQIIWGSTKAIRDVLTLGGGEGYLRWPFEYQFEALDREGLGDLVVMALTEWQGIVAASAKTGKLSWMALNDFAAAGRGFASEGQDDRAILMAKTIAALARTLKGQGADRMQAGYEHAVDSLQSLAQFDRRSTSELKTTVDAELTALGEPPLAAEPGGLPPQP